MKTLLITGLAFLVPAPILSQDRFHVAKVDKDVAVLWSSLARHEPWEHAGKEIRLVSGRDWGIELVRDKDGRWRVSRVLSMTIR